VWDSLSLPLGEMPEAERVVDSSVLVGVVTVKPINVLQALYNVVLLVTTPTKAKVSKCQTPKSRQTLFSLFLIAGINEIDTNIIPSS
jgi:hypothetical protein